MVGSTQIMIQNQVYADLELYRDKHGFKSFTVAIKSLLSLQRQIAMTYSKVPSHTVQTISPNNQTPSEKIEFKNEVAMEGEVTQ